MVEREQEALEDPLLQFLYELSFEAASEHLALCEDVLASDFFLSGSELAAKFMQCARLLVLELMSNTHRRIGMKLLARNLCMGGRAVRA